MSEHDMPHTLWAWPFNPGWKGGYYRTEPLTTLPGGFDHLGAKYIRVDLHEAAIAEALSTAQGNVDD